MSALLLHREGELSVLAIHYSLAIALYLAHSAKLCARQVLIYLHRATNFTSYETRVIPDLDYGSSLFV